MEKLHHHQHQDKESLSPVERASLDALSSTLRDCHAHMSGSAIRVALDAPERKFFRFELDRGLAYVLRSP